jgi:barstar (barnase inhibitor)
MHLSINNLPFLFLSAPTSLATPQDFLLKIPRGIETKTDLFLHYEKEGHFPGYFGHNWDALLDCLRDFSWKDQKRIVIAHEDVPLTNWKHDLRIYLEILETAVNDWKELRPGPFAEPPSNMPYVAHELVVGFPSAAQAAIVRVLGVQRQ